jgi:hypothetical protein
MGGSTRARKQLATYLVLAAVGCLALATWAPTASARTKYLGRVSCNVFDRWQSDSVCFGGDLPGAHFRVWGRDEVRYTVCVTSPHGNVRCKRRTTGASGHTSSAAINTSELGRYGVVWRIHGRIKASASFKLKSEGV